MSAFSSQAFASDAFSSDAFGGGPAAAVVEEPNYGGRQFYDHEALKQRRLHEQLLREDEEIAEFLRILLSKGIL